MRGPRQRKSPALQKRDSDWGRKTQMFKQACSAHISTHPLQLSLWYKQVLRVPSLASSGKKPQQHHLSSMALAMRTRALVSAVLCLTAAVANPDAAGGSGGARSMYTGGSNEGHCDPRHDQTGGGLAWPWVEPTTLRPLGPDETDGIVAGLEECSERGHWTAARIYAVAMCEAEPREADNWRLLVSAPSRASAQAGARVCPGLPELRAQRGSTAQTRGAYTIHTAPPLPPSLLLLLADCGTSRWQCA